MLPPKPKTDKEQDKKVEEKVYLSEVTEDKHHRQRKDAYESDDDDDGHAIQCGTQ